MFESRKLNGTGLIQQRRDLRADARADVILYKYAMQMVSSTLLQSNFFLFNPKYLPFYDCIFFLVQNGGRRRTVW